MYLGIYKSLKFLKYFMINKESKEYLIHSNDLFNIVTYY